MRSIHNGGASANQKIFRFCCPTHHLSNLLDIILKLLVCKVKIYIKDDFDFLCQLPKQIDFDSTFITFDVKSLYTSIPHDLGIEAFSYWVNRFPDYLIEWHFNVDFIVDGLRIILENNIFKFDDVFYHQLRGTAMGIKVAVIYAILRMGFLERKLYSICSQYYPQDYVTYIYQW